MTQEWKEVIFLNFLAFIKFCEIYVEDAVDVNSLGL